MRRWSILKSILNVADPCAPMCGRTWANALYRTAILKKAGATISARRLHGTLVTFTNPESHLVSFRIQSLKKDQQVKKWNWELCSRELSFDWPKHAFVYIYMYIYLTITRKFSFLARSDHQSTFLLSFFLFLFSPLLSPLFLFLPFLYLFSCLSLTSLFFLFLSFLSFSSQFFSFLLFLSLLFFDFFIQSVIYWNQIMPRISLFSDIIIKNIGYPSYQTCFCKNLLDSL